MTFANRHDAGRQLGAALLARLPAVPIVVGISRGGVPVAAEVAHTLRAPLEIIVVRKLFSPGSPSFAIGAVAEHGAVYVDDAEVARLGLSRADVKRAITLESLEVARLGELRDGPPRSLARWDAILVDGGVANLDTLLAAVRSVRAQQAASVTLAVPLGNSALVARLAPELDRVVCLVAEDKLVALGSLYRDFGPVSEHEVAAMLATTMAELTS